MRRTPLSLTALAAVACLALAGCSGSSSSSASKAAASETPVPAATAPVDCSTLTIDSDSESLPTIGGDAGTQPTVSWKKGAQAPKNLTVKTLTQGTGAEIDAGGVVKANYTGWQWDGTDPFDTSFKSGAPATFPLENVIQGWKCGLTGHHVGDRVLMSIPPELAYGNKAAQDAQAAQAGGAQRQQNPAGTLVFVVEIVDGASSKVSGASATATMEGEEAVSQRGMTVSGELGQPAGDDLHRCRRRRADAGRGHRAGPGDRSRHHGDLHNHDERGRKPLGRLPALQHLGAAGRRVDQHGAGTAVRSGTDWRAGRLPDRGAHAAGAGYGPAAGGPGVGLRHGH